MHPNPRSEAVVWSKLALLGFGLLAGCSDYSLAGQKDEGEPLDSGEARPLDTAAGNDTSVDTDAPASCEPPNVEPQSTTSDDTCKAEAITGTFTPVIEWTDAAPGDTYTSPVVGRLTDDNGNGRIDDADMPDIAVANSAGKIFVLSGDGSGVKWSAGALGSEPMTPAIGDVDGDGWPDVVGAGTGGVAAYRGKDGALLWSATAYSSSTTTSNCGAVALADLDGDGAVEVIVGRRILAGADGSTLGTGNRGDGNGHGWAAPIPTVADLDLDGTLEVVVGNAAYDKTGATIAGNGASDGYVAVANFDDDAQGEMAVTSQGTLRLQDDDFTVLWTVAAAVGSTSGPPTVADFDGDGEPEIGIAGMGQYAVYEKDGTRKWSRSTHDSSSGFTGSSVFDFEGDGAAEVVYADENDLFVFDGSTGAVKLQESQHSSATCSEYPTVADVDNDGHAEIIYASGAYSGPERGVTVVGDEDDSWMAGRPIWNQHAYSITNIEDDGTVPAEPDPNWLTYNNFRSGDLVAATGGDLPNATVYLNDLCNLECSRGRLWLTVVLGNEGALALPVGVPVSVYGVTGTTETLLATQTSPTEVAPGSTSEGIVFELDATHLSGTELVVRADDDGTGTSTASECDETDNRLEITDGLCP